MISFLAYVGCIVGANWALTTWGIVPIGFGLMAPAGVYFAGLSFTARDFLRESMGRKWMVLAVVIGAVLSFLLEDGQRFAIASGVAFLFSEFADAVVYEPLRKRWLPAVLASNIVGLMIDSALFLWLAFGSLAYIEGQIIGKAYMTTLAIGVLWSWNALFKRRDQAPTQA